MWRWLLYKSWLETRSRFLWGSLLVLGTVGNSVFQGPIVMRAVRQQLPWLPMPFPRYLWETVYHGSLVATWIGFVVLLGLGGLRREHSTGVSAFTLSLPARRSKFLQAQAVVALAEALVMGFLPALLVPALSRLIGQTFAIDQAICYAVVLVGAGLVFYGWTVLLSHLTQGGLTALTISASSIGAFFVLVKKIRALDHFDIFDTMCGEEMLDKHTFLLHGPLPWARLGVTLTVMLGLVGLSMVLVEYRDF